MSLLHLSLAPSSRSLAFSALRRRRTNSTSAADLSLPRWNHCLNPPPSVARVPPLLRPRLVPRALTDGAGDLIHNAGATAAVLAGAYAFVFVFNDLTRREVLHQSEQKTGPYTLWIALSCFLANFQDSNSIVARYFAAFVPLVNCLRLLVNGLSLVSDEGLIKSVTREGEPQELLRGPLYYVFMLIVCTLVFWRESPVGVVSLAMMCGGDGIADIIGRRFGSMKIPYNKRKSIAGSISMLVFGSFITIGMLYYYSRLGYMELDWLSTFQSVAMVSLVATIVESLPISEVVDDNISVPLAAMAVASFTFHH